MKNKKTNNPDNRQLMKDALLELKKMQAKLDALEQEKTEPIAVIGMGCRFPGGADTPAAFWKMLCEGVDTVTEIPASRWDVNAYYDSDINAQGKMYTRSGSFLHNVDGFDAPFFDISAREAERMDPQQRLLLEVAWEAIEAAGLPPDQLRGSKTGVFIGCMTQDYLTLSFEPKIMDIHTATGISNSIGAGRLSYILGLNGPTLMLDTACSSSLVAVHIACQSLRLRESDLALAGGVNLILIPETTIAECRMSALSPDGRCKTFDKTADGYGRGEGCGIVLLKRLSDAVADGDFDLGPDSRLGD